MTRVLENPVAVPSLEAHMLPLACDLRDARRYLPPDASPERVEDFARRQLRSRNRLTRMLDFYRRSESRMTRLHLLAACAIALGRFAGYSKSFDEIGEALMPVDFAGEPRTPEWTEYAAACAAGRPWEVRDELWLAAHMKDLDTVRAARLDAEFYAEAAAHEREPTWQLLRQHMEVTLGVRLMDRAALSGAVAYETAIAESLTLTVRRLFTAGWLLLGCYAWEATRALVTPTHEPPSRPWVSYRRTAFEMMRYSLTAWTASRVFRRGVRARERGRHASEDGWPLLEEVLGERVGEVHPLIVDFYTNPAQYAVKASVRMHTLPAKFWSRVTTLVIGQGLYESDEQEIDARFRVFRRADGSMHFIRELYCGDAFRVFDSDFIVRDVGGRPTLFEVFVDMKVEVEMNVAPLAGGGLSISGRNIYLRKRRLPHIGLQVEFRSRVERAPDDSERLHIDGHLLMQPRTRAGRFIAHRVLRRPVQLASIHYVARPLPEASPAIAVNRKD